MLVISLQLNIFLALENFFFIIILYFVERGLQIWHLMERRSMSRCMNSIPVKKRGRRLGAIFLVRKFIYTFEKLQNNILWKLLMIYFS